MSLPVSIAQSFHLRCVILFVVTFSFDATPAVIQQQQNQQIDDYSPPLDPDVALGAVKTSAGSVVPDVATLGGQFIERSSGGASASAFATAVSSELQGQAKVDERQIQHLLAENEALRRSLENHLTQIRSTHELGSEQQQQQQQQQQHQKQQQQDLQARQRQVHSSQEQRQVHQSQDQPQLHEFPERQQLQELQERPVPLDQYQNHQFEPASTLTPRWSESWADGNADSRLMPERQGSRTGLVDLNSGTSGDAVDTESTGINSEEGGAAEDGSGGWDLATSALKNVVRSADEVRIPFPGMLSDGIGIVPREIEMKLHATFHDKITAGLYILGTVSCFLACCACTNLWGWGQKDAILGKVEDEGQIHGYDHDAVSSSWVMLRILIWGSLISRVWLDTVKALLLNIVTICMFVLSVDFVIIKDGKALTSPETDRSLAAVDRLLYALGGGTAIILSVYLKLSLDRWWTLVESGIGGMWQEINNLCMLIGSHCSEPRFKSTRDLTCRYGLLCQSLLWMHARGENTPAALEQLLNEKLLTNSEMLVLQGSVGSKPQTIFVWIMDVWVKLYKVGAKPSKDAVPQGPVDIDGRTKRQACEHIMKGKMAVKEVIEQLNNPLPFGLVHMAGVLTQLTLVLLMIRVSAAVAAGISLLSSERRICEGDAIRYTSPFNGTTQYSVPQTRTECINVTVDLVLTCTVGVVGFAVITSLLNAMLHFAAMLQNPLEPDPGSGSKLPRFLTMNQMLHQNKGFFALAGKGQMTPR